VFGIDFGLFDLCLELILCSVPFSISILWLFLDWEILVVTILCLVPLFCIEFSFDLTCFVFSAMGPMKRLTCIYT